MRASEQNMTLWTKAELQKLMTAEPGPCVSLFLPAYEPGANGQMVLLRLQKLLEEAREELGRCGLSSAAAQALLAPVQAYMQSYQNFWPQQREGLAFFLAPDTSLCYGLPVAVKEQVKVSRHFYFAPLLPLLSGDGDFYLLALSQNEVRLFHGSRTDFALMALPGIPHSLAEAQQYTVVEPTRQVHSAESGGIGGRHLAPVYTGQGSAGDEKLVKKALTQFLQQVDHKVNELLAGQSAPLLVAGVDVLRGLYRELSHYRFLLPQHIDGNPDRLSADELHEQAWPLVASLFQQPRQRALALYQTLAGQTANRTMRTVRQIMQAAYAQRIDTLFVAAGAQQAGSFDEPSGVIEIYENAQPSADDLVNLAILYTLQNHGSVYEVAAAELPDAAPMAAILRY